MKSNFRLLKKSASDTIESQSFINMTEGRLCVSESFYSLVFLTGTLSTQCLLNALFVFHKS